MTTDRLTELAVIHAQSERIFEETIAEIVIHMAEFKRRFKF